MQGMVDDPLSESLASMFRGAGGLMVLRRQSVPLVLSAGAAPFQLTVFDLHKQSDHGEGQRLSYQGVVRFCEQPADMNVRLSA
jgi:hypothetical protein